MLFRRSSLSDLIFLVFVIHTSSIVIFLKMFLKPKKLKTQKLLINILIVVDYIIYIFAIMSDDI